MSSDQSSRLSVPTEYAHRLLAPRLVCLVGSCALDKQKTWNIAPVSNVMSASNVPQRIGIAIYKESTTYQNILRLGEFTINMPDESLLYELWLAGHRYNHLIYPADFDKMKFVRLTPSSSKHISVPTVAECFASLECRVAVGYDVGDHHLFVGDVLNATLRENLQSTDWRLPLNKVMPVLQNSGDQFAFPARTCVISKENLQTELDARLRRSRASS